MRHDCREPDKWWGSSPTNFATSTPAKTFDTGWQLMVVFLLTMFTAVVLLAAGFLLGLFWLRDEHARLTALREEVGQKSVTVPELRRGHDANLKSRGESSSTSRHHQAG